MKKLKSLTEWIEEIDPKTPIMVSWNGYNIDRKLFETYTPMQIACMLGGHSLK